MKIRYIKRMKSGGVCFIRSSNWLVNVGILNACIYIHVVWRSNIFFAYLQNRRKLNVRMAKWHGGMAVRVRSFRTLRFNRRLYLRCWFFAGACVYVCVYGVRLYSCAIPVNRSVETPLAIVSVHSAKRASLGKSLTVCMVRVCKGAPSDMASSFSFFRGEKKIPLRRGLRNAPCVFQQDTCTNTFRANM